MRDFTLDDRPQSITRWLLGFVMPAKLNDSMLRVAEAAKIRTQVDASHLLTPPPSRSSLPRESVSAPASPVKASGFDTGFGSRDGRTGVTITTTTTTAVKSAANGVNGSANPTNGPTTKGVIAANGTANGSAGGAATSGASLANGSSANGTTGASTANGPCPVHGYSVGRRPRQSLPPLPLPLTMPTPVARPPGSRSSVPPPPRPIGGVGASPSPSPLLGSFRDQQRPAKLAQSLPNKGVLGLRVETGPMRPSSPIPPTSPTEASIPVSASTVTAASAATAATITTAATATTTTTATVTPAPSTPGKAYALNEAPDAPDSPASIGTAATGERRPRVLNQMPIERTSVCYTDSEAQPTSHRAVRPSLETIERTAAYVLHMEQYYDALTNGVWAMSGYEGGIRRERNHKVDITSFQLGRVIGQGAFGVVRIATERAKGRIVAIKQLRKSDLLKMGQEGHVRAEKDVLAAASSYESSWIPRLYYTFQDHDHLFLVLEFMGGGDLLSLLINRGRLPESMVKFYAAEMVLALHECHTLGYIHRDVKPDNFLFNREGHLRIADFGLATDLHWSHDSSYYETQRRQLLKRFGYPVGRAAFGNRRRSRQQLGIGPQAVHDANRRWKRPRRQLAYTICGTNSYMAPEVIMGTGYGFGADWWGLGVIVYEAIYGSVPFNGENRHVARQKILDWRNSLVFPREPRVSPLAIDFMRQLMCNAEDRLGYCRKPGPDEGPLGNDGAAALMAHPWFADIDWDTIADQTPPFRPDLSSVDDTKHFDADIPDEPLAPANSGVEIKDPLLGNEDEGRHLLEIRKSLAFKQWTFRSPCAQEWRFGRGSRSRANSTASALTRIRSVSVGTTGTAGTVPRSQPTPLDAHFEREQEDGSSTDIDLDFDRCSASTSFHASIINGAGLTVLPLAEQMAQAQVELPTNHVRTNRYEERFSVTSSEDDEEDLDRAVEWEEMFRKKRVARIRNDLRQLSVRLGSLNHSLDVIAAPIKPAPIAVPPVPPLPSTTPSSPISPVTPKPNGSTKTPRHSNGSAKPHLQPNGPNGRTKPTQTTRPTTPAHVNVLEDHFTDEPEPLPYDTATSSDGSPDKISRAYDILDSSDRTDTTDTTETITTEWDTNDESHDLLIDEKRVIHQQEHKLRHAGKPVGSLRAHVKQWP